METDCQKMYNNLTVLLQDICQFLSSDKLGSLSHRDKKLVESLITRSKVQLQEISKIEKTTFCEEYVDMDAKKVSVHEEEDEKPEIYSSVDDINKTIETTHEVISCPYADLPAKETQQNVKSGYISMRRKFLLGFEKMKRVYAAIHHRWLVIYYSDKDLKPICTFNLKHYEAKETDGPKSTNFELISTLDRKVYYFMALTPKDMLQWTVYINRCHDNVVVQSKGLNFEKNDLSMEEDLGEHYDIVVPGSHMNNKEMEEEDEDDIYLELDEIRTPSQNNNTIPKNSFEYVPQAGPPLPGRRPHRGGTVPVPVPVPVPLPVPPPFVKPLTPQGSEESLASYDDIKELLKSPEQSTDDEDSTYEAFVHVKQKITKMSNSIPKENTTDGINEYFESTEVTRTNEIIETKQMETIENIKDKLRKSQCLNSPTAERDVTKMISMFSNKNSVIQEVVKKPNTPPNTNSDLESSNADTAKNKFCQSPTDSLRKIKGAVGLSPPVIRKVPVIPLKPKVKDKPFIGKRPPFSSFRQITGDR